MKPVVGWTSAVFTEIGILLAIRYTDTPLALENGESTSIQLALSPQLCLKLADKLTTPAKYVLDQAPPAKPMN